MLQTCGNAEAREAERRETEAFERRLEEEQREKEERERRQREKARAPYRPLTPAPARQRHRGSAGRGVVFVLRCKLCCNVVPASQRPGLTVGVWGAQAGVVPTPQCSND